MHASAAPNSASALDPAAATASMDTAGNGLGLASTNPGDGTTVSTTPVLTTAGSGRSVAATLVGSSATSGSLAGAMGLNGELKLPSSFSR